MTNEIRIGARGSKLSLTQAEAVAAQLRAAHPSLNVRLVIIQTTGDQLRDVPLTILGGQGVFTKEIERALLNGDIDVAVHSLKDLPTILPDGLQLAAITRRESPNDCLVAAAPLDLRALGPETPIGTSSLRRQAQLLRLNPRLRLIELRGNVPTRIDKMLRGDAGAVVLAAAGLKRLGLEPPWVRPFSFAEMLPAPGQGALGLEIRSDDAEAMAIVSMLNDADAWVACRAERAFLRAFGGGCRAPIAALGEVENGVLALQGMIASADALQFYRDAMQGPAEEAERIGAQLAEVLLRHGAQSLLDEVARENTPQQAVPSVESLRAGQLLAGKRIVVTRDEDADGPMSNALRDLGAEPLIFPLLAEAPPEDPAPLQDAARAIDSFDWIVFSSIRAVRALAHVLREEGRELSGVVARIACVGPKTAAAFAEVCGGQRSADVVSQPERSAPESSAALLLRELSARKDVAGRRVLYPRAEQALPALGEGLRKLPCDLVDPIAYRTTRGSGFASIASLIESAQCDAITFASPSAAAFFVEALGAEKARELSQKIAFAAIGPTTSALMRQHGLRVVVEAQERTYMGLAKALKTVISHQ